jgi:PAS domain S-box-containing protein
MVQRLSMSRITTRPGFWLIVVSLALITALHYGESLQDPSFLNYLFADLHLSRHAFERIFYLAPIIWASLLFGRKGGVITSFAALACMLPRVIFFSQFFSDALFETSAVFIVGNLMAFGSGALQKERQHRIQLSALNKISSVISMSLELKQILNSSIDNIKEVMSIDIITIFILDEKAGELVLTAHHGVSEAFVRSTIGLRLGEGFNGRVAQTGEPMLVEDACQDTSFTRAAIREENIQSQLIVPLKSKGKVVGTISVAKHSRCLFSRDKVDLLSAIGNQIGVAVENARLYQKERDFAAQLRASEERYRGLFENAQDAIWLHDMDGNIISANNAAASLTGYDIKELSHMNVISFLSEESIKQSKEISMKLLHGEPLAQPYEQKITTKQRTEAILKLTTSIISVNGEPVGFQHIARDITLEKQMQENLHYYLEQVTRAQEEERKRIARELHDETIQEMVVLARQLDSLASIGKTQPKHTIPRLAELRQQLNDIMRGVRRLSQDLRPAALDRLGLLPALEWLASNASEYSGLEIVVTVIGSERRFSEEIELLLFRITQEALRNVWRHAEATQAEVIVEFEDGKTRIMINDNGKGFDLSVSKGNLTKLGKLGLTGMQERTRLLGGSFTIQSQQGKGTKVMVEVPL